MGKKQIGHTGMAVCLLAGCLLSCRKEFTCPQQSRVEFTFDWQQLPSAAEKGEGMSLRFYASDGQVYDMESDTGSFRGSLPVGSYQVLLRNRPTPGILFRDDGRFETAEAYLPTVSRASGLVGQPDWFFSAALADCEIVERKATELTVVPKPMVHRITFRVKITDERPVESVSGQLQEVVTALNLSTGKPVPQSSGETDIPIAREKETFSGSVLVFNIVKKEETNPDEPDKNLKLNVLYTNGTNREIWLDISDELSDLGDEGGSDAEVDVDITPERVGFEVRIIEWVSGAGPDISVGK